MAANNQRKLLGTGQRAPAFKLPGLDGAQQSLAQLQKNGMVVLVFFKVTCPVCELTFPYFERIYRNSGVNLLGISQDDVKDTTEFLHQCRTTFPVVLDEPDGYPVSEAYSISNVPSIFVIASDGTISASWTGWIFGDMDSLARRLSVNLFYAGENVPKWKGGCGSKN